MNNLFRHPLGVPIRYTRLHGPEDSAITPANTIDECDLCFFSSELVDIGSLVRIEIRVRIPPFEANAYVTWCIEKNKEHEIGVNFVDQNSDFNFRMVEQVCQIEHYKNDVLTNEGRRIDSEQAAAEWIGKYAKDFPY